MTTQPTVYRPHLPMQTRPNGSERESRSPDGQVVGAASVTLSQVIDSYFCHVNVTPDHRRRGIGMRLDAEVYDLIDPSIPVLARAMSSQPLRRRFAESIGCTVLVHCPEPWVEPSSAPGQQWIAQQTLPDGYQTVTMNNLPIEQVEKRGLHTLSGRIGRSAACTPTGSRCIGRTTAEGLMQTRQC
jgi:hypothetical protein